ncbi:MAG: TraR/DksA C4-type zinc finger protein [Actinomycetota bacterium]
MTATIDTAAAEATLNDERVKVVRQMADLGADPCGELNGQVDYGDAFADAGAVTAERTEVLALVETLKARLDDVDAALQKIAEGTYGACETCGKEIGPDRMEYRPTSRRCVECKSAA